MINNLKMILKKNKKILLIIKNKLTCQSTDETGII